MLGNLLLKNEIKTIDKNKRPKTKYSRCMDMSIIGVFDLEGAMLQKQDFTRNTKSRNIGRKDPIMTEIEYDQCQLVIKTS